MFHLQFVKSSNVNTLNFIIVLFDFFGQIVGTNLFVFDNSGDNKFENTKSQRFFLVFLSPDQTVHRDFGFDFGGQSVQIGFVIEWFDIQSDHGFSGDNSFFGGLFGFSGVVFGNSFGFQSFGGGFSFFVFGVGII